MHNAGGRVPNIDQSAEVDQPGRDPVVIPRTSVVIICVLRWPTHLGTSEASSRSGSLPDGDQQVPPVPAELNSNLPGQLAPLDPSVARQVLLRFYAVTPAILSLPALVTDG